jgi:hypothetical protein
MATQSGGLMGHYRTVLALVIIVAAGCSSGGPPPAAIAPQVGSNVSSNTIVTPTGGRIVVTSVGDKNVRAVTVLAPVDSVWKVLTGVYIDAGVEIGSVDQQQHYISNTSFVARHSLGGTQVSRYMDCGSIMGAKTADQATVTMSLIVQVVPDSGEISQLRTQFEGYAIMDGAVANRITCTSTGAFEARIARMVNDELAHRTKH